MDFIIRDFEFNMDFSGSLEIEPLMHVVIIIKGRIVHLCYEIEVWRVSYFLSFWWWLCGELVIAGYNFDYLYF